MSLAVSSWQTAHLAAHFIIFFGYVVAMVLVPRAFASLIRITWVTKIAGSGFFVFCGITHVGIALHESTSVFITVTDHLQAGCILVFVFSLGRDIAQAVRRLAAAYQAISVKYGEQVGTEVVATLRSALE